MNKISLKKPKCLKAGDKLATVSLSWGGPSIFPNKYDIGKKQLETTLGVAIVEMEHTLSDADVLDKNPQTRASDLMQAFADPTIIGIVVTVGGEDSIRLIPYFDYELMGNNPKVFLGCSDTTVTHLACFKAGITSFYGPMIFSGFSEEGGMHQYLTDSLKQILFTNKAPIIIPPNKDGWTVESSDWSLTKENTVARTLSSSTKWRFIQGKGIKQGHLLGGCMEVLEMVRGTEIWPTLEQWDGAILFIETSQEAPPPTILRRALRTYAAEGVLKRLNGILFGRPGGQTDINNFHEYDDVILQIVRDEEGLNELAVVTNLDFGHSDPMMTLPYGAQTEIDCSKKEIKILEPSVTL